VTAEFPDNWLAELAERQEAAQQEAEEFAGTSLADLQAEIARREADLDKLRAQCLQVEIRVVERRLLSLREEMARRD
jgi:capsule polysaccharide export protein KpsE/RkpR